MRTIIACVNAYLKAFHFVCCVNHWPSLQPVGGKRSSETFLKWVFILGCIRPMAATPHKYAHRRLNANATGARPRFINSLFANGQKRTRRQIFFRLHTHHRARIDDQPVRCCTHNHHVPYGDGDVREESGWGVFGINGLRVHWTHNGHQGASGQLRTQCITEFTK